MEERMKDLEYWRKNAEDNYMTTPISVLRYIGQLEEEVNKQRDSFEEAMTYFDSISEEEQSNLLQVLEDIKNR